MLCWKLLMAEDYLMLASKSKSVTNYAALHSDAARV
jgi:hypothetical protein